jgi:hypothetical protein
MRADKVFEWPFFFLRGCEDPSRIHYLPVASSPPPMLDD